MQIAECNAPVAKNIAGVIENKGLKQVYIAEKAGYSPQELNDMLNGRRLIKANDIARISLVLGVDVNCLYGIEKGDYERSKGCEIELQGTGYHEGDIFPREGGDVSEERIKELAGSDNKQHTPLIELVEEDPDNTADTDTAEKPPKAGKKRSENKVPENKEPAE